MIALEKKMHISWQIVSVDSWKICKQKQVFDAIFRTFFSHFRSRFSLGENHLASKTAVKKKKNNEKHFPIPNRTHKSASSKYSVSVITYDSSGCVTMESRGAIAWHVIISKSYWVEDEIKSFWKENWKKNFCVEKICGWKLFWI